MKMQDEFGNDKGETLLPELDVGRLIGMFVDMNFL